MTWNTRAAKKAYRDAANRALLVASEALLAEANQSVPIEEGTLMRSGQTSQDPAAMEAVVSYDTVYARRQHEDLSLRHDAGRRAKWLESALTENEKGIRQVIADEMRRRVP